MQASTYYFQASKESVVLSFNLLSSAAAVSFKFRYTCTVRAVKVEHSHYYKMKGELHNFWLGHVIGDVIHDLLLFSAVHEQACCSCVATNSRFTSLLVPYACRSLQGKLPPRGNAFPFLCSCWLRDPPGPVDSDDALLGAIGDH